MAQGKRVLFVAEKMAALEVVQRRLESISIGPFCLELHSNKAKKKDVLEQLRKASEVTKSHTAEEYAAKAEQIAQMRMDLDCYTQALHRTLNCGTDLYTLINEYENYRKAPNIVPFSKAFIKNLTKKNIDEQQLALERVIAAAQGIGHPNQHPLSAVGCTCYTQNLRSSLQATVGDYAKQIEAIQGYVEQLATCLGEALPQNYEELQRLCDIAAHMIFWYDMPDAWSKVVSPQIYFDGVMQLAQHSICAGQMEENLLERFDVAFLSQNGAALFDEFAQNEENGLSPNCSAKTDL